MRAGLRCILIMGGGWWSSGAEGGVAWWGDGLVMRGVDP